MFALTDKSSFSMSIANSAKLYDRAAQVTPGIEGLTRFRILALRNEQSFSRSQLNKRVWRTVERLNRHGEKRECNRAFTQVAHSRVFGLQPYEVTLRVCLSVDSDYRCPRVEWPPNNAI